MSKKPTYVRKTISISPYIEETIVRLAENEFSGNVSALLAHLVMHYVRCQRCALNDILIKKLTEENSDKLLEVAPQLKGLLKD